MKSKLSTVPQKGLVFNIQRFSVHDGPGIRTTVFMKGCPLSCYWCSNPESQDIDPQLMIRDVKCVGCGACVDICPANAIHINAKGGRELDWDTCDQCLKCVDACVYGALAGSGNHLELEEVLREVMSDRLFYKNSGGGITLSGGEPLLQSEFAAGLLKACKEEELHTAVDTTGFVHWQNIQSILPWTDLLLWDMKHLDETVHKQATGVGTRLILENLSRASKQAAVWLRIPLICGFNDDVKHMEKVVGLAGKIGAEKISLLPYHEGGRSKNEQIGRTYSCDSTHAPAQEHVDRLREMITHAGIDVGIGN